MDLSKLHSLIEQTKPSVNGNEVFIPEAMKEEMVYRKYEAINPMICDTQHGDEWIEELVVVPALGLGEDDSCIVRMVGRVEREVGITSPQGEILNIMDVEAREELTGNQIPRHREYGFRILWIRRTDGLARRTKLQETYEQQRLQGEANVLDTIAKAFKNLTGTTPGTIPASNDIDAYLKSLTPEQRQTLLILHEDDEAEGELVEAGPAKEKRK